MGHNAGMRRYYHPASQGVTRRRNGVFLVMPVDVRALLLWDKASLERAKAWWLSTGVELCGKRDAYNAVARIDQALRAK